MTPNFNFNQQPQVFTWIVQNEESVHSTPIGLGVIGVFINFEAGKLWIKTNPSGIPQPARLYSFKEEVQQIPQNGSNGSVTREEFNRLADAVNRLISDLGGNN